MVYSNFVFLNLTTIKNHSDMFGDLIGMMGKLKATQEKVKATKERLHSVLIEEASDQDDLKVTITANRTIKNITIGEQLMGDREQLETKLVSVLNKAIEKATDIQESELSAVAREGMPNIPGLDSFLKGS